MGKGKGIAGIIIFSLFALMAIAVKFSLEPDFPLEAAANINFITFLLMVVTGLLIPGILCLKEIKIKQGFIYLYSILPTTLLWIILYTFLVSVLAPLTFMSTYLEFMGLGFGLSILLGHLVAGFAYLGIQF